MVIITLFITLALIGMAGIALVNTLALPRLSATLPESWLRRLANSHYNQPGPPHLARPHVSILIPARNEAAVIGPTVRNLLAQSYPDFELIVLDDHSDDETLTILQAISQTDSRLRVLPGRPLPAGWLGKNWACHQLAQAARGRRLIFTDADVRWSPVALAVLLAELRWTQADLLTVWPTQQTESWAERLVVPLMALVIIGYLPLPLVHYTAWPMFAAANGQCLVFRRRAYEKVGGHAAVRSEVLEDVILARRLKAQGLRLRMADGAGLIGCRMYQGWSGVRDGYAKNILAGYGDSVLFLGLATIFHWLLFVWPWLWLGLGWFGLAAGGWPAWPLILIALGLCLRALSAATTRQRLADAVLMPLSALLMTRIALQAVWQRWRYGGPQWKGRLVRRKPAQAGR